MANDDRELERLLLLSAAIKPRTRKEYTRKLAKLKGFVEARNPDAIVDGAGGTWTIDFDKFTSKDFELAVLDDRKADGSRKSYDVLTKYRSAVTFQATSQEVTLKPIYVKGVHQSPRENRGEGRAPPEAKAGVHEALSGGPVPVDGEGGHHQKEAKAAVKADVTAVGA